MVETLSPSNYGTCYEPIQRIYRNAVVTSARHVLTDAFANDWRKRVRRLFPEDARGKIEQEAEERRITGELRTNLVDELDYLGVNQFSNLFEAFFDVLFPANANASERTRKQERQAILSWAREVRALRDPMSHPSEEDLPYEDAFRMLDSARRILLKLDTEAGEKVRAYTRRLAGGPIAEAAGRGPEGYLPPEESIAVDFVGREKELDQLQSWLVNPRSRRWALMGERWQRQERNRLSFCV